MGYSVGEGVKSPSAQRPSTTQIFSSVMSLAVWEQSIPGLIMPHTKKNVLCYVLNHSAVTPSSISLSRTMHPVPSTSSHRIQRCIVWPGMIIRCGIY